MFTAVLALAAQTMAVSSDSAATVPLTDTATAQCPKFTASNLSAAQSQAATAALNDICAIFASDAFAEAVEAQRQEWQARNPKHDWVAGCRGIFKHKKIPADAAQIVDGLRTRIVDFNLHQRDRFRNGKVNAVANLPTRDLTIKAARFDDAASGSLEGRAALVNTLSHELTHMIPASGTSGSSAYIDAGFSLPFCPGERLVSYGVQNIVEREWRRLNEG